MAIFKGIISKMSGFVGNLAFRRVAGQTIVSEKMERKAAPVRSRKQMIRRMQWGSVVALYRAFDGKLHPSFENKSPRVSDINEFVCASVGGALCRVCSRCTKVSARRFEANTALLDVAPRPLRIRAGGERCC